MIKDQKITIETYTRIYLLEKHFTAKTSIAALFLVGSQNNNPTPLSDIDIAVLGEKIISFEELMDIQHEISHILGSSEIDLIDLGSSNLHFAYTALREGKQILVNNELRLADFTEYVCDRVFDYQYHLMEAVNG